jgi:hypothetical protein
MRLGLLMTTSEITLSVISPEPAHDSGQLTGYEEMLWYRTPCRRDGFAQTRSFTDCN